MSQQKLNPQVRRPIFCIKIDVSLWRNHEFVILMRTVKIPPGCLCGSIWCGIGVVTMKISWSYINYIHQHSIYIVINDWDEVCFFPLLFDECTGTRIPPKLGWKKTTYDVAGILWLTWLILLESDSCTGTTGWHCLETCCQATAMGNQRVNHPTGVK